MSGIAKIDENVPFGACIYWWLQLCPDQRLDALVRLSAEYEQQYLAWQEVKRGRNPFFENGTGFEGYFVGNCTSPEEALEKILSIGETMLMNLIQLHRFDHRFQSKLIKTLTGEVNDFAAISEWAAELGAELARLRCNVSRNHKANDFQVETYRIVKGLPPISYSEHDHTIQQHYSLLNSATKGAKMTVFPESLHGWQQESWLVAQSVGKLGHPLVREYLRYGNAH